MDDASLEAFRDKVLSYMCAEWPGRAFRTVPGEPGFILVDGVRIGLDNLMRKYNQSDKSDSMLKEMALDHLKAALPESVVSHHASFDELRDRIMPQIMPPAIAMHGEQVKIDFVADLFVGIVVDTERTYQYLLNETLTQWGKTPEEMYAVALDNLARLSKGMEMQQFSNDGITLATVSASDGYDAARILLPHLRKMVGGALGFPFYFGIPNRDFLICWSTPDGSDMHAKFAEQIKADFAQQPYPISPLAFQVSGDDTVAVANVPR